MDQVFVAKFGGSSLADARRVKMVADIIKSRGYRYVVVSGPGARTKGDPKVTDLLIRLKKSQGNQNVQIPSAAAVRSRFTEIVRDLGISIDLEDDLKFLGRPTEYSEDMVISRGEPIMARILAKVVGGVFHDAAGIIKFRPDGKVDIQATERAKQMLLDQGDICIIPGFYGSMEHNGDIKTFPRNYSDVSGAWIASIVGAHEYHIYSDTPMMRAHPDIVPHARRVEVASYDEVTELASMGATVIHPATMPPLERSGGRPIRLFNTNLPDDAETLIVPDEQISNYRRDNPIVGIAGQDGYTIIRIKKRLMGEEIGADKRIYAIFDEHKINVERSTDSSHNVDVIVKTDQLNGAVWDLQTEFKSKMDVDVVDIVENVALVSVVGATMVGKVGITGRLFTSLAKAGLNVLSYSQTSRENNITFAVLRDDKDKAILAAHDEFEKSS